MSSFRLVRLPKNKEYTCPVCHGTGQTEMTGDLHKSAGIIPCPNILCAGGTIIYRKVMSE